MGDEVTIRLVEVDSADSPKQSKHQLKSIASSVSEKAGNEQETSILRGEISSRLKSTDKMIRHVSGAARILAQRF